MPNFDGSYSLNNRSDHAKRESKRESIANSRKKMRELENTYATAPLTYHNRPSSSKRRQQGMASSLHSRTSVNSSDAILPKKRHRVSTSGGSMSRLNQSDSSLHYGDLQGKKKTNKSKKKSIKKKTSDSRDSSRKSTGSSSAIAIKPSLNRGRPSFRGNDSTNTLNLSTHSTRSKSLSRSQHSLSRSQHMQRSRSQQSFKRSSSNGDLLNSDRRSFKMTKTNSSKKISTSSQEQPKKKRRLARFKEVEEKPRKSLVIIWLVVFAELGFDLGTTIIAFQAMWREHECCGYEMNLGPLPMSIATPFIALVFLELAVLFRAIILTLWPSLMTKEANKKKNNDGKEKSILHRACCCCLEWNVRMLLKVINLLVILNPFFGCIIAWMLLYQSDKTESFVVLGLEAGSILLHFLSIWLEGTCTTIWQLLLHCLPMVPFIASVILVLVYLKQEGVCYIVERSVFLFQGCELCPNDLPPVDGFCTMPDGTLLPFESPDLFDFSNFDGIAGMSSKQSSYCGIERDDGLDEINFCFFEYE